LAQRLSQVLGVQVLDSGAMYRAFALIALEAGCAAEEAGIRRLLESFQVRFAPGKDGGGRIYVHDREVSHLIRAPRVTMASSDLSRRRDVREFMTERQRALAQSAPMVAEGRDMGTVVFPDAPVKFFLSAEPEIRALRRYLQLREAGHQVTEEAVRDDLLKRDLQDRERHEAPLKPAADATWIDSSFLSTDQVLSEMLRVVKQTNPEL